MKNFPDLAELRSDKLRVSKAIAKLKRLLVKITKRIKARDLRKFFK